MTILLKRLQFLPLLIALVISLSSHPAMSQEVIVLSGIDGAIQWFEDEHWWGEEDRSKQLTVPHVMMTGFSDRWRKNAAKMPVPQKKEIFYRLMLPLIMHANSMVLNVRKELDRMDTQLKAGQNLSAVDIAEIRRLAVLMRIMDTERSESLGNSSEELLNVINALFYKLDVIPAGLVLGQAAYESGYGTSRFAVQGNALFGQWTYGGKGLKPEQQRKELGDHRIASFDWPFDSVRGYYINLNSHPAYEEFRRLRAEKRAAGEPLTSMALADGLIAYSERGQEYIDTLKGIMRVNGLTIADDAIFRDEPIRFLMGAENDAAASTLREDIEIIRATGELDDIISRMRLE
jgi:Bax protein